jgi:antitoxin ParD1/3/4
MHINLSPEMEKFIQGKVEAGFYSNATEVIRDAIRRMHEEEQKVVAMRAALKVGDDQLDKGERVPYTADLVTRAAAKAKDNARRGRKVNPDVTP